MVCVPATPRLLVVHPTAAAAAARLLLLARVVVQQPALVHLAFLHDAQDAAHHIPWVLHGHVPTACVRMCVCMGVSMHTAYGFMCAVFSV